jgi:hypothetical protein
MRRYSMPHENMPVCCPGCGALLVGIEACPDPDAHEKTVLGGGPSGPVYGGQLGTLYRVNSDGHFLIPFRRFDGEIREYPCQCPAVDPMTRERLPWLIAQPVLDSEDLPFVTGLSPSAFNNAAAGFPGRVPGTRRVLVETTTFLREYVFGTLVRQSRWRRTTRAEKRARHRIDCRRGCRKHHRTN